MDTNVTDRGRSGSARRWRKSASTSRTCRAGMDGWLAATLASEPWPYVMGPLLDRGAPNGVVWVGGREVARWGDPGRREMAFSIAKSALGTVAGLAFDDGLLPDLDLPVVAQVPLTAFGGDVYGPGVPDDPTAARRITWRHLLTQTSEWRGTLFDVPWWADPQGKQEPGAPERHPRHPLLLQRRAHQPLLAGADPPARGEQRGEPRGAGAGAARGRAGLELARPRPDADPGARAARTSSSPPAAATGAAASG